MKETANDSRIWRMRNRQITRSAANNLRDIVITGMLMVCACAKVAVASDAPAESKEQRDARMAWWREAKFGMFIHWGVFSVPAGYYNGKHVRGSMCDYSEWIMYNAKIPVAEYQAMAKEFNPVKFDAGAWVRLARDAGMKYIIISAKHHDGFAMFASQASKWNICDATPFGRDPLRELAAACRLYGIKLGFYYSQAQDWNNGGSVWGGWDGVDKAWGGKKWDMAQERGMDDYIDKVAVPQVRELLTQYGKDVPSVIWWDTYVDMNAERAEKIQKAVRELRPDIVMNDRLGGGVPGDMITPEQNIPARGYPGHDWETCMTMNDSWGYKKGDNNWKPADMLLRNLIDIASKGGNYLLNVGPTAEGLIPGPSVERLSQLGAWMSVNGEAIYGTGPTPFGAEAGSFVPVKTDKTGKPVFHPCWEWRCTSKPGKLYIHLLKWPANHLFQVPGLRSKVFKATLLAAPGKLVEIKRTGSGVMLSLPAQAPDSIASVVRLDIEDQTACVEKVE